MLVPEFKIIEELKKIYLTDECSTSDLREVFSFFFVSVEALTESRAAVRK